VGWLIVILILVDWLISWLGCSEVDHSQLKQLHNHKHIDVQDKDKSHFVLMGVSRLLMYILVVVLMCIF
jgi:hypothetical protein